MMMMMMNRLKKKKWEKTKPIIEEVIWTETVNTNEEEEKTHCTETENRIWKLTHTKSSIIGWEKKTNIPCEHMIPDELGSYYSRNNNYPESMLTILQTEPFSLQFTYRKFKRLLEFWYTFEFEFMLMSNSLLETANSVKKWNFLVSSPFLQRNYIAISIRNVLELKSK